MRRMLRRLFSFRKKKEARPRWWLDCDERVCPVQLLCQSSDVQDVLAYDQSLARRGHQCTTTSVDDYEGVSWLEQLERPEWPVPKHCFENRDEDLSVSSCVESIWRQRSRAPSTSSGTARSVGGGKDPWPLRAEDGARDAVMAKLGLQVTCLGSGSPLSKSYPGRKAVFSAHRGLSLYKSGGDTDAMANTAAAALGSPVKNDHCGASTPELKPGAGDHRNLLNAETLENKYRNLGANIGDEQGEQNTSSQQNLGQYASSAECANFMVFHAETLTSGVTVCKHLEGLLEECQANSWKESIMLDEGCSDADDPCGSANAGGFFHTSASSGDIKLDHIEDIGRRLHSTVSRQNGGGCGVEEDRRLQLGLGDFDHLDGTIPCNRHRRDVSSQSEVTGSGDCKEGSGASHLPSTLSPIPTDESGEGSQLPGGEVMATKENPCKDDITETKTLKDDSFSSDVTLTDLSIGDGIDEADFEVASEQSSELGEEFLDADYVIEPGEGLLGATFINPTSVAHLYPDFAPTARAVQNELTATPRESPLCEWGYFDAFKAQQRDGCFDASEGRPFPIDMVRRSASVSGEGFEIVDTNFPGTEATTVSAGSSPAYRPPKFPFPACDKELRQLCPSPACSLDGQVSASSCDSFLTVASYDDDTSLPKINQTGAAKGGESSFGGNVPAAVSPLIVGSPLLPAFQSFQNFQSYEDRANSSCNIEQDTDGASISGEPNGLAHDAADEPTLHRDGCSSSTTTLSFQVLDQEAGEASGTSASSRSEDSDGDSPASLQSESPPSSPLEPSSFRSPTLSSMSNRATCSSSVASSPFSLSDYRGGRDSLHNLTDAEPSYSLRASFASDDRNTDAETFAEYDCRKTSTPSSMSNHATRSSSVQSSPFSLPDYRSCRDFLRNLKESNPELSHSLSESFARDERNIDLDTSVEDACRQIFSSYNESFAQFESVQSFTSLPRFSTTEMLTCPELRPLRLSGRREDVFEPVLSRDPSRRLKRQAVPTASDTEAFASRISEKRTNVSSASSVSMPDLKR